MTTTATGPRFSICTRFPPGTWNERLLAWINVQLEENFVSLPGAMQAFAESREFYNWSSMNTLGLDSGEPEEE